ncbi:DegT/DnrJ/EryC1/StrS family aminotransferase [Bacillus sp. DJP31]|uniref:DegT/DnrJ/EryC1/StrS family aminotransferase n=1 Tax=Bacillus sp. DJP31 TaxID=3409789 RepID=UPI003BB4BA99
MINKTANKRIYLSSPHLSGAEMQYVNEAFETNWVSPIGRNIVEFEREIANLVGVKGAVALSSCTAAIHLALSVLGVKKDDVVFCSSLTFVGSTNPILYQGASPVFIDSEPSTWNMSPQALESAFHQAVKINKLPKAVIIVHLYGQPARMDELMELCDAYQVPIIEDAAESLGSLYKGKASGSMGALGVYSFNGNKIITTSGGGMLVSNDLDALAKARFLAAQAKDPAIHYQHSQVGYNYGLSNISAGIGRGQLQVLCQRVHERRNIYQTYEQHLSGIPGLGFMPELSDTLSNRWLTVITINEEIVGISNRDLVLALEEENIEVRPVWKPMHLQPLFENNLIFTHDEGENVSETLFDQGLCLPSGSNMTMEDQERVIHCVKKILSKSCNFDLRDI